MKFHQTILSLPLDKNPAAHAAGFCRFGPLRGVVDAVGVVAVVSGAAVAAVAVVDLDNMIYAGHLYWRIWG